MPDAKHLCRTPTLGKQPVRIDRWKYDLLRRAILKVVPEAGDGLRFQPDLIDRVGQTLSADEKQPLGSPGWHVTTVRLEMEVAGELGRAEGKGPQRLLRR